jgi:hypothetical protein
LPFSDDEDYLDAVDMPFDCNAVGIAGMVEEPVQVATPACIQHVVFIVDEMIRPKVFVGVRGFE